MTESRLVTLIVQKVSGELSPDEAVELDIWAGLEPNNKAFLDRVTNEEWLSQEMKLWENISIPAGYKKQALLTPIRKKVGIRRFVGWSAAAAVLVATIAIGVRQNHISKPGVPVSNTAVNARPVLPGRNTATITLSNGQEVLLDSAGNGNLAIQGNARLVKRDDKLISYAPVDGKTKTDGVVYNKLTTPRSGQYQLILPDGSKVWLNNVSSLRYPTSFVGDKRIVELTGEAYFEIAKDPSKPFLVQTKEETVEVLGTSFNIMAYEDEGNIRTTLLNGAVRVKAGNASVLLKPDEQAKFNSTEGMKVLKDVPSQDIVSWKNGFFYFGRASLKEVMRQLARWYDVDVEYQGAVPDQEFGGSIDRDLPFTEVLNFLDKNQVHYKFEGRKIIVLP